MQTSRRPEPARQGQTTHRPPIDSLDPVSFVPRGTILVDPSSRVPLHPSRRMVRRPSRRARNRRLRSRSRLGLRLSLLFLACFCVGYFGVDRLLTSQRLTLGLALSRIPLVRPASHQTAAR